MRVQKSALQRKREYINSPKNTHKLYVNNTPAQSASPFGKFKYIADAKYLAKNAISK